MAENQWEPIFTLVPTVDTSTSIPVSTSSPAF
jgi:hypothetical protein